MKKALFLMLAVLLLPLSMSAGEIVFGWNKVNESGTIFDMEFMPDKNYFIMATRTGLQIRETETGELVNSYPEELSNYYRHIEFTPDSLRLIYVYRDSLRLINLSDMKLIKEHIIPPGTDTDGLGDIWQSGIRFIEVVVDPVRPYVYVIRTISGTLSGGKQFLSNKVIVYNYETMEEVKELISFVQVQDGQQQSDEYFNSEIYYRHLAVSTDGKYLALLSEGNSHLRVWDFQTMSLKNKFELCEEDGGGPCDIKFSEKNMENIYFSGAFPNGGGLFTYSIQDDKLNEPIWQNLGSGCIIIFQNEEKIVLRGFAVNFLELSTKMIEYQISAKTPDPGAWNRIINSDLTFIGFAGYYFSMGKYDPETSVSNEPEFKQIVYPNPTNGFVNVTLECSKINQYYEVYNSNSNLIIPSQKIHAGLNNLNLDFTKYSSGIYFLRIYCGKTFSTYKIVKKG